MLRSTLIERIIRQVYGGMPNDDASLTKNLVNTYINEAIATAAKNSSRENLQIEGVSYVNNSFYATVKGLAITEAETIEGDFKCTLPNIPIGLGKSDGIATARLFGENRESLPLLVIPADTVEYLDRMPKPKITTCWNEGSTLFFRNKTIDLTNYKATVRMVSGGNANDMNSELNVPDEFLPQIHTYVRDALLGQLKQPQDVSNDGIDKP